MFTIRVSFSRHMREVISEFAIVNVVRTDYDAPFDDDFVASPDGVEPRVMKQDSGFDSEDHAEPHFGPLGPRACPPVMSRKRTFSRPRE